MDLNLPNDAKIAVAMSGGVDSSVAAALLADQGYEVFGMMLRLWSEPGAEAVNRCCTPDAMARARQIAGQLGIPFYVVDAKDVFRETVVNYFISGYTQGVTPNPCLICNRHIRWEFLLNRAMTLGAKFMATGHYARVRRIDGEPVRLLRGLDPGKDQSYVLSVLNQEQLSKAVFPIGEFTKAEVRQMAEKFGLPSASIKDSQDLCFLAGSNHPDFLARHAPESVSTGPIIRRSGEVLGEHNGLAFYTIGQRKGLGIAFHEPLYVMEKDSDANTLIVGTKDELGKSQLEVVNVNWVTGQPVNEPFEGKVKIRYTAGFAPGTVTPTADGQFTVQFNHPLRDITPGQAAVVYRGDEAVACGIITEGESVEEFKPIRLFE